MVYEWGENPYSNQKQIRQSTQNHDIISMMIIVCNVYKKLDKLESDNYNTKKTSNLSNQFLTFKTKQTNKINQKTSIPTLVNTNERKE